MKLVFNGPAHLRELSAEDYKKLGIEVPDLESGETETYARGVPFEVNKDVAKILLESPLLRGEFSEYVEEDAATEAEVPVSEPVQEDPPDTSKAGKKDKAKP